MRHPKETLEFWKKAEKKLGFEKEKTLFVDDTEAVLRTAKEFGIRYILHKVVASSKLKPKLSKDFMHIFDFEELMKYF